MRSLGIGNLWVGSPLRGIAGNMLGVRVEEVGDLSFVSAGPRVESAVSEQGDAVLEQGESDA